jgi:hypothetical protein
MGLFAMNVLEPESHRFLTYFRDIVPIADSFVAVAESCSRIFFRVGRASLSAKPSEICFAIYKDKFAGHLLGNPCSPENRQHSSDRTRELPACAGGRFGNRRSEATSRNFERGDRTIVGPGTGADHTSRPRQDLLHGRNRCGANHHVVLALKKFTFGTISQRRN